MIALGFVFYRKNELSPRACNNCFDKFTICRASAYNDVYILARPSALRLPQFYGESAFNPSSPERNGYGLLPERRY